MPAISRPIPRSGILLLSALLALAVSLWLSLPILAQSVITTIPVPNSPRDVAVNPITNRIYVAQANSNLVSVIDGKTNTVVATIPVSRETFGFAVNPPFGVAVNPTTNRVYVAVRNSNALVVIDGNTNAVVATVPVEGGPIAVAVNPTTNRIYVVRALSDTLAVVDGVTQTVVASVPVGFGTLDAAVNPTTNRIYVANNNRNTVLVIDGTTNKVVATVPAHGPLRLAVNPTTNRIDVANSDNNTVAILDGNTQTVVAAVPVRQSPTGVAVNPTTNRIYVANNGSDTVSVIDGTTHAVVATVPVDGPLHLAVNPTTNRIYVANDVNDTVSVMEDLVPAPAVPLLPGTGSLSIAVVGLIGLALVTLGIIARRVGLARCCLVLGLGVLLATIGTPWAGAAEPHRDGNAVADAPAKRIALTFDDGYNSRNVNLLLDILDRAQVRATFFPVGIWVKQDPVTFRRIAAHYEVGNHTYSHPFLTRLSDAAVRQEILGGVIAPPFLFRPPYGDIDARVRGIVQPLGLRVILWDVDSRDWTGISPAQVTRNVVQNAGDGKIILMHMGDWNTVQALPQILAQLQAQDFRFVTVSELRPGPPTHPERCFAQSGFCVADDAIWAYFIQRGGVQTFGYPVSRSFLFLGRQTQFFQRIVMQETSATGVQPMNLLDPGLLPYTRINGATFPAHDPAVAVGAPAPNTPNYGQAVLRYLQATVPNTWNGRPVNFLPAYLSAAPTPSALGDPSLVALEIWGFPTSRPMEDPNNHTFVYQRFQRGILHFQGLDAHGNPITGSILVADWFKSLITGRNLPSDLEAEARADHSRFLRQYCPDQPNGICRPAELPETDLRLAFEREQ